MINFSLALACCGKAVHIRQQQTPKKRVLKRAFEEDILCSLVAGQSEWAGNTTLFNDFMRK
jgi:hypothetical protein